MRIYASTLVESQLSFPNKLLEGESDMSYMSTSGAVQAKPPNICVATCMMDVPERTFGGLLTVSKVF